MALWGLLFWVLVGAVTASRSRPPAFRSLSLRGSPSSFLEVSSGLKQDADAQEAMQLIQSLTTFTDQLEQVDKTLDVQDQQDHQALVQRMHEISTVFKPELTGSAISTGQETPQNLAQLGQVAPGDTSWLTAPSSVMTMMDNPWMNPRFRDAYDQWREAINFADVLSRPDYEYKALYVPGVGLIRPYINYPRPWMNDDVAEASSAKWGGAMGFLGSIAQGALVAGTNVDKKPKETEEDPAAKKAGQAADNKDASDEAKSKPPNAATAANAAEEKAKAASKLARQQASANMAPNMQKLKDTFKLLMSAVPEELKQFVASTGEKSKMQIDAEIKDREEKARKKEEKAKEAQKSK